MSGQKSASADQLTITDLAVYQADGPDRERRAGETVWCVAYTVRRPGFVDRDYCPTFVSEEAAWRHVWELHERVGIPDEVRARLGHGSEEEQ